MAKLNACEPICHASLKETQFDCNQHRVHTHFDVHGKDMASIIMSSTFSVLILSTLMRGFIASLIQFESKRSKMIINNADFN